MKGSFGHAMIPRLEFDPLISSYLQCTYEEIDQLATLAVFTYKDVYLSNDRFTMKYPSNFQVIAVISVTNTSYIIYQFETINFKPYSYIFPTMSLQVVYTNKSVVYTNESGEINYALPWSNLIQFKAYSDTGNCDTTGKWLYGISKTGIKSNWPNNHKGYSWKGTATGSFDVHSVVIRYIIIDIVPTLEQLKTALHMPDVVRQMKSILLSNLVRIYQQFHISPTFKIIKFEVQHALIVYYEINFMQTVPPLSLPTIYKKIRSFLAKDNNVYVNGRRERTYVDPQSTYLTGKLT